MKIVPVAPVYPIKNNVKRSPAFMVIHGEMHEVVNTSTNERFALPARKAWLKYDEITRRAVDVLV